MRGTPAFRLFSETGSLTPCSWAPLPWCLASELCFHFLFLPVSTAACRGWLSTSPSLWHELPQYTLLLPEVTAFCPLVKGHRGAPRAGKKTLLIRNIKNVVNPILPIAFSLMKEISRVLKRRLWGEFSIHRGWLEILFQGEGINWDLRTFFFLKEEYSSKKDRTIN